MMMNEFERIKFLTEYLNQTTQEYDDGHPSISDEEWDAMYFELKELEESTGIVIVDSPTQVINYQIVNSLEKVEHNHKMLSLDKTKETDEVSAFLGKQNYIAMCKMDGLTCSLHYQNGNLVSAETRGNGVVGENILHNARVISSIPNKIKYKDELIIDGEIICSYKDFEGFSSEYKNPRNFAAGSIRLLDSRECEKRKLQFVAWDIIKGFEELTLHGKLQHASSLGFTIVPYAEDCSIEEGIEYVQNKATDFGYPIDGVVFKFDDIAYGRSLGETSHHFKNAIAYKFYDETYPTFLDYIEWTMGRTGVLTPVAVFEPIDIDGSTVERASLHNVSIMEQLLGKPYHGQPLEIFKANMIIPQVSSAIKKNEDDGTTTFIEALKVCPICGEPVQLEQSDSGVLNYVCPNPSCDGKLINRLDHFCGKKGLDIRGLSKATLEKLIDWGWIGNIREIFSLSNFRNEWIKKPGFGVKSVDNILNAIENAKTCELHSFITALGIPLIGSTYAKQMAQREYDWFNVREDIAGHFDFTKWDGFGPEMCASLWRYNYDEADILAFEVLNIINSLWKDPNVKVKETANSLEGITVVITGKLSIYKNRSELQAAIEAAGGKVASSVSKNTKYLINNDNTSTSSKNLSAQKLGVPIVTESDFIEKFL